MSLDQQTVEGRRTHLLERSAADVTVLGPVDDLPLLGQLAGELTPPIERLAVLSELLVDGLSLSAFDGDQRLLAATLRLQALWLQDLVENMLTAAAIESGRLHLQLEAVYLQDVVRSVAALLDPALRHRRQRIRLRIEPVVPPVWADARWIGQVLVNLLLNAIKFTGLGSSISVQLSRRGRAVRLVVADRGPGLQVADTERLFQPFVQGDGDAPPDHVGVGLGLAIARSLLAAQHGRIVAENRRGGGARLWFELPVASLTVSPPRSTRSSSELVPDSYDSARSLPFDYRPELTSAYAS